MDKGSKKPLYICDGRRWCNSTENCYMNGGLCKHTKRIEHAKNFQEWGSSYAENAARSKPTAPVTIIAALMLWDLLRYLQSHFLRRGQ